MGTLHLQISPLNGNFTDSCSDSSYFIPTLRAHHLADHVLTGLPPSNGDFTDSCSDSSLLWELIIRQTRSSRSIPPIKWQFHRLLWNSYFIPTLRAQHLADQVLTDLPTPIKWQFHRFLLYSESSYLADQVLADHPLSTANFTDCCSDSSYFIPTLRANHLADQVLTDLPSPSNGNFTDSCSDSSLLHELNIWHTRSWQIWPPTSDGNFTDFWEIHISFLLWELNIWLTRSWQIYEPLSNGNFTDSCSTLKAHICQTKCWQINPPPTNGNFTDVSRSTSPSNSNFTDFCSTLRAHI